ncbi:SRPBCC family protein [Amycolatopsis taiwanensis]|uniref:SRPBCC family protein n=1 Tax=Amycolatopsis taiwanensis TaxID=342230 RepID=UPI000484D189|nr:SRPBCC family protein [Amycolatopsis taiwanensis]
MDAELETLGGKPVLRFERRLAHPVAKVWRAVTDPAEMAHWFPATVETELKTGAKIRFGFGDEAAVDDKLTEGEILEYDPPKVYVFRWNADVFRVEVVADGDGCLLYFSQTLGGGPAARLAAGRHAAGWDHCLDSLQARLDGREAEPFTEWLGAMERYIDRFGLGEGEVSGTSVHFARDLIWKPIDEVWQVLTGGAPVEPGGAAPLPATNGYVPAGQVTRVEAPRLLEYSSGDGLVRWEITADPRLGVRVELTQQQPADVVTALAAWHTQLELFFAAVHGEIRCPWPEDRTEQLKKHYREQLKGTQT